jgi:sugar/nucleoside kinase (ribokinase family)
VGDDAFGEMLVQLLRSEGVDTTHLGQVPDSPTTLALVAASSPDEQSFVIYRGADTRLRAGDMDRSYVTSAEIFLYGSVTLTDAGREAALQGVRWANEDGRLVAYDANLRPALWPSLAVARHGILEGVQGAAICKVNETELELLAGTGDLLSGSRWILEQGPKLCVITLGSNGAFFNNGRAQGKVPGFSIDVAETTGCGDAFFAGLVLGLLEASLPLEDLDEPTLRQAVRFANATGALTATTRGAMAALPTRAAVNAFVSKY